MHRRYYREPYKYIHSFRTVQAQDVWSPMPTTINKEWFKNESELVWIRMNRLYAVNHSWMNHYDEQIRFV